MSNFISIIVVAALGVIGNIIYFEYQTHKKTSKDLLKQKLTQLLLPLYVALHLGEIEEDAFISKSEDGDYGASFADLPKRVLSSVEKIIKNNMWLADDQLHEACVDFLQWAYASDTDQRLDKMMLGDFDSAFKDDEKFKKFYNIVMREYNDVRHQYLKK
jgi:hypothetical protein